MYYYRLEVLMAMMPKLFRFHPLHDVLRVAGGHQPGQAQADLPGHVTAVVALLDRLVAQHVRA